MLLYYFLISLNYEIFSNRNLDNFSFNFRKLPTYFYVYTKFNSSNQQTAIINNWFNKYLCQHWLTIVVYFMFNKCFSQNCLIKLEDGRPSACQLCFHYLINKTLKLYDLTSFFMLFKKAKQHRQRPLCTALENLLKEFTYFFTNQKFFSRLIFYKRQEFSNSIQSFLIAHIYIQNLLAAARMALLLESWLCVHLFLLFNKMANGMYQCWK